VSAVESYIRWAPYWSLGAFLYFLTTKIGLGTLVPGKISEQGPVTIWKWTNIANSLSHSAITGIGTIFCLYRYPFMAVDVITSYTLLAHVLVAFSDGYFIFDFFDMLIYHRRRSSYELMLHHIFVVACFSLAALTGYYLGYALIALLVEVNSVFLHWRQLLILQKVPKYESLYKHVSILNLVTFLGFRIAPFTWMTRWLIMEGHTIPYPVYLLGCTSMTGVVTMNIILFSRLLRSDLRAISKPHSN
jgi:hypothetical protein